MIKTDIITQAKNNKNLPLFRFKQIDNEYLITNEIGEFSYLSPQEFLEYTSGSLNSQTEKHKELIEKSLIKDENYIKRLSEKYRKKRTYMKKPTHLHIMVLTLKCNHKCVYCHASVGMESDTSLDMSEETAKKSIDMIFSSPGKYITIEFQGGESTANWKILQYAVDYIQERKKTSNKFVFITLVSNLTMMNEEQMNFLLDNEVHISTSLDGPEDIHNMTRVFTQGNSFDQVTTWIKKINTEIRKRKKENPNFSVNPIGALVTISKPLLSRPQDLVQTYRDTGLSGIFLRPMNPIGFAKKSWGKIGYTTEEFIEFYEKALDHILELNKQGTYFRESLACIKLQKMIAREDSGYVDDISPCGGGIGQIAYNYDGGIYTCDEGRMIAREGDDIFKMGNVHEDTWDDLIESHATKSICAVSCNDGYAGLENHVYKPYIGVCPATNYASTGQMHPNFYESEYFKRHEMLIDILFKKLKDPENEEIFRKWIKEPKK